MLLVQLVEARRRTRGREHVHSDVQLSFRLASRYGPAEGHAERLRKGPGPPRLKLTRVRGRDRGLRVGVRTHPGLRLTRGGLPGPMPSIADADTVVRALRWVYVALSPRRFLR